MATTKTSQTEKTFKAPIRPAEDLSSGPGGEVDALRLLQTDHAEVATLFEEYADAEDEVEKEELAQDICAALTVHAQIEEEIFYPAAREVLEADDLELVTREPSRAGALEVVVSPSKPQDAKNHAVREKVRVEASRLLRLAELIFKREHQMRKKWIRVGHPKGDSFGYPLSKRAVQQARKAAGRKMER